MEPEAELHVHEGPDGVNVWIENAQIFQTAREALDAIAVAAEQSEIAKRALELANTHPQRGCWWLNHSGGRVSLVLVDGS